MELRHVLIISRRPLFCEALKCVVEEMEQVIAITAPDEESAQSLCAGTAPDVVVIDRPHVGAYEPVYFLPESDKRVKVVLLGWEDGRLAVCSCERVLPANLQNFANVIKKSLPYRPKHFERARNRIR
jgi:DNA-binding NarL/FixJ family response regulator